ncbi:hypothetical protein C5E45_16480 [Nocardia nova]|uniref:HTH cro/C1-type domain-containing protein n=1 Tax=Nocardia nova TaxID=37330 RepID=A0A2S6APX5_9NOCA|nr:helix-turn-helix domain-containing protein [Nocardia nova]PPJ27805.1 hypothetical protein C5E41_14360 [Nocardia nova]PPJ37243.1 hypothetical protein C5E45_16480 [Nocardia nova]
MKHHGGSAPGPRMPDFYDWLQRARLHLGLSREDAAKRASISTSYVNRIERDHAHPAREVVERLARAYQLNPWQKRHTFDLWEPSATLPPTADLRCHVDSPAVQAHLDHLDTRYIASAYLTPLSTVLQNNRTFGQAVPGLDDCDHNLALWFFTPTARRVIDHWDHEAHGWVAVIRAMLGRYRDTPQAQQLLRKLRASNDFQRVWESNHLQVSYGRRAATPIRLHIPCASTPVAIGLQVTEFGDRTDLLAVYGMAEAAAIAC